VGLAYSVASGYATYESLDGGATWQLIATIGYSTHTISQWAQVGPVGEGVGILTGATYLHTVIERGDGTTSTRLVRSRHGLTARSVAESAYGRIITYDGSAIRYSSRLVS
jgi:hypothetical protein